MNAKKCFVMAVVIVLSAAGSQALAQVVSTAPVNNGSVPYGAPYGGMGYGQMYAETSSTVAEAYLKGMSKVIRAEGDYNLSTSQAAINAEEALRQNIQNRQALVKAYFELRKMNRDYRAAERHPGLHGDSKAKVAQVERPRLLTPAELDSQTGKVRWPKLLAANTHAENRELLDAYFAKRASGQTVGTRDMAELRSVVVAMLADLKEQLRAAPPAEYQAANEFLHSLAYEGQRPLGGGPRLVASAK
jgi:hypothetical protein